MNPYTMALSKLAAHDNSAEGDYIENGILMCGKCRTPKQTQVELPDVGITLVPANCECMSSAYTAKKAAAAQAEFLEQLKTRYGHFGVSSFAFRSMTFAKDTRQDTKLSRTCRRYVERWDKILAENIGLLFYGTVGTGKSFYACCIANALLDRGISAAVTSFPRLLNLLQGANHRQDVIDHLQTYKLLVIDDFGNERDSSYATEQVLNVVDARVLANLPLIITTNLTIEELKAPADMQSARIYDRILEVCTPIKLAGDSYRAGNAQKRTERAREILSL